MVQGQVSISWLAWGALHQPLVEVQGMQAFEIERQTHQTPFCSRRPPAPQRELAEAQDLLDDPDDGFHGAFAQTIDCLADLRLEFVSHLDERAGLVCGWFRLLLEKGVPIEMMRFASGGDIGLNAPVFTILNVGFAEVAVVHCYRFGLSDFSRHRVQGRQGFPFIIGMIGEAMGHDQHTFLIGGHLHIVVLVKAIIRAVLHNPRIGIGEVVLILVAGTGFGRFGWTAFGFVMTLAGFASAFFQFGFILGFFRSVAFVGASFQNPFGFCQINQTLLPQIDSSSKTNPSGNATSP